MAMITSYEELDTIINRLVQGTILTKFYAKNRVEKRTFMVRLETRQMTWLRPVTGKSQSEGTIDLREIKEVRLGLKCDRPALQLEEMRKLYQPTHSFVILYGSSFRLKHLACVAATPQNCEQWIKGIKFLSDESFKAAYPLQFDRWLRKEFQTIENTRGW